MTDSTPHLTPRETQILRLMCAGLRPKEIAQQLGTSHRTVETHRGNVMSKAGCKTAFQLGMWAVRSGLAPGDGWSPIQEFTGPTMPFSVIVPTGVVRE